MLIIGNLVPNFTAPVTGCFFWGWVIDVDIQLTLLVPFYVAAYLWNRKFGHASIIVSTLLGIMINIIIVDKNNFKVGWLTKDNWDQFAYLIEKPWNHIASMCMGVFFAVVYLDLLQYRRLQHVDTETKLREYFFTH